MIMSVDFSGYGANLEESEKKLVELGSILDQTDEVIQKASSDLREIERRQESANQAFQENANDLLDSLSEFGSNSEARLDDVNRAMEGIQATIESNTSKITTTIEFALSLISNTQQELSSQEGTVTTALSDLSDIISQFLGDANLSIECINSEIALFTEGTSQLGAKVSETSDSLSGLSDRISSMFDELTNDFLGSLRSSTDSMYVTAFSTLTEAQSASVEETLASISSQLEDLLENFSESCTLDGEELIDNVSTILENCASDISVNIEQKLRDAFEDAIENMLQSILQKLGTTVGTMTAGASISGAMMPLVPLLKGVGTALETLNNTLDFFD
jgi:uncharacterized protein YoxC